MTDQQHPAREEITVGAMRANLYMIALSVPLAIVLCIPFYFIWQDLFTMSSVRLYLQENIKWIKAWLPLMIFAPLIIGVVLHETLHGAVWARYASQGFRSIRFGISWKTMTPYCHCKEPLTLRAYRLGVMMPGIALGLAPLLIAFVTGNIAIFVFGFCFTLAAGGDFLMLYLLRNESSNSMIQDHPDKIGCYIFRDKNV